MAEDEDGDELAGDEFADVEFADDEPLRLHAAQNTISKQTKSAL